MNIMTEHFDHRNHEFFKKNGYKANIKSKQQYLVWCVIDNPEKCSWPKEIKMASKLLKDYPDLAFWKAAPSYFEFKPASLAYCLSIMGNAIVKNSYPIFQRLKKVKLKEKKRARLTDDTIGEDIKINKKPKNVFEFIRNKNG
jgi:hypothetical protein